MWAFHRLERQVCSGKIGKIEREWDETQKQAVRMLTRLEKMVRVIVGVFAIIGAVAMLWR
jgi:uncharacterized protein Yka (UPF0111/DUF47 family)